MTSLFLIPETNITGIKGIFRRLYLLKAIDLPLIKQDASVQLKLFN